MTEESPTTDGGTPAPAERDVRRAGERPPDVPARTTVEDLLPRLLEGVDDVGTAYHVRARLAGEDPSHAAEQLVEALERKVTVVGTTLDAGVDPGDPQLDVLIETDHTMSQVATALARVAPVDGAVVLDATEECEHVLDEQEDKEEANAASANDVFNELQEQVSQADYDQVVDELEDVSFPGGPDPEEEVDLADETGVELDAEAGAELDAEVEQVGGDSADDELEPDRETIDLDADSGMDPDDVSAAELFGEADPEDDDEGTVPDAEADETAIEQAVRNVEQGMTGDGTEDGDDAVPAGEPAPDDPAPDDEAAATPGDADEQASGVADAAPSGAEPAAPADDAGPAAAADEPPAAAGDGGEAPPRSGAGATAATGDEDLAATVDALVEALESGDIGPERRQRLREALGIESTHSLDVRLEYLQKRVDNLAAYNDSWEALLAEEGSGDAFVEEVRSRLDDLEGRVGGGGGVDPELVERIDALEGTVEQLETAVEHGDDDDRVAELAARVEQLESRHEDDVARLEDRIGTLRDAVEKLKQSLRQFASWRESVNERLSR